MLILSKEKREIGPWKGVGPSSDIWAEWRGIDWIEFVLGIIYICVADWFYIFLINYPL